MCNKDALCNSWESFTDCSPTKKYSTVGDALHGTPGPICALPFGRPVKLIINN